MYGEGHEVSALPRRRFSHIPFQRARPPFPSCCRPRCGPFFVPRRNCGCLYFGMNAWRTPGRVLGNHAENETAQFLADAFSSHTASMPRKPSPIQLEPCSAPTSNSLWLDQDQHLLPSRPKPPQDYLKEFVLSGKPQPRASFAQNRELLPKSQVFQEQIPAREKQSSCKFSRKPQQVRH